MKAHLYSGLVHFITVFAILLAMAGIYGLSSNAVIRRTHEIGLRRAIGASDGRVIKLFLAEGTRQLAFGLIVSAFLSVGLLLLIAQFGSEFGGINAFTLTLSSAAIALVVSGAVLTAIYLAIHRAVRHATAERAAEPGRPGIPYRRLPCLDSLSVRGGHAPMRASNFTARRGFPEGLQARSSRLRSGRSPARNSSTGRQRTSSRTAGR